MLRHRRGSLLDFRCGDNRFDVVFDFSIGSGILAVKFAFSFASAITLLIEFFETLAAKAESAEFLLACFYLFFEGWKGVRILSSERKQEMLPLTIYHALHIIGYFLSG